MAVSAPMPRLGESVSEGTVTRWLKKEGDQVQADEPLLEVSTDKVDTEIPSPAAGVLKAIKVGEDETVEVGSELAVIDDGSGGGDSEDSGDAGGGDEAEAERDEEPQDAAQETPADPEPEQETAADDASDGDADQQPQRTPEDDGDDTGESAASTEQ